MMTGYETSSIYIHANRNKYRISLSNKIKNENFEILIQLKHALRRALLFSMLNFRTRTLMITLLSIISIIYKRRNNWAMPKSKAEQHFLKKIILNTMHFYPFNYSRNGQASLHHPFIMVFIDILAFLSLSFNYQHATCDK